MKRPHEDLEVWKQSIDLVKEIYVLTKNFPDSEKFGIISKLRRASVSVPANIAEGSARNTKKEFLNFLFISSGSLSEIETLLLISEDLDFINNKKLQDFKDRINHISAMLNGLIKKVKRDLR